MLNTGIYEPKIGQSLSLYKTNYCLSLYNKYFVYLYFETMPDITQKNLFRRI